MTPEQHHKEAHAAYQRGLSHGYEQGLRDGRLSPDDLRKKMDAQIRQHRRRHTDWPKLETQPCN